MNIYRYFIEGREGAEQFWVTHEVIAPSDDEGRVILREFAERHGWTVMLIDELMGVTPTASDERPRVYKQTGRAYFNPDVD